MVDYKLQIKLITESIFGSGHSIPGSVDLEVVYDDIGLPFMKAKTFKGNFRESMEEIIRLLDEDKYKDVVLSLLGEKNSGLEQWKNLKFSDMRLSENIRITLENAIFLGKLDKEEIKEALTEVRSFTSIDEYGSSKDKSLRHIRVIKKDLVFEVELHLERELKPDELGILSMTSKNLRHIGSMRTRGKGEVECTFLVKQDGQYVDKSNYYMESLIKGVNNNV